MKPYPPNQHYAVPRTQEARLEIVKAILALAEPDYVQKASADDPQHPGWPAGTPDGRGGKFRPKDGSAAASEEIPGQTTQLAASRADMDRCVDICYPILERFQPAGSDRNQFDFYKCLNECLGRIR
jgi:hypothetical protein